MSVVVVLEVVDVDDRDAERRLVRRARAISCGSISCRRPPVRQAGERIAAGEVLDLPEQMLAFGLDLLHLGDVGGAGVDQGLVRRELGAPAQPVPAAVFRLLAGLEGKGRGTFEQAGASATVRSRSSGWIRSSRGSPAAPRGHSRGPASRRRSARRSGRPCWRCRACRGRARRSVARARRRGCASDDLGDQDHHDGEGDQGEEPAGQGRVAGGVFDQQEKRRRRPPAARRGGRSRFGAGRGRTRSGSSRRRSSRTDRRRCRSRR